jgi:hypothetical protein
MSFDDDLEAAVLAEKDWADVEISLNGKYHVLRFFEMDALLWADQTDRFPARPRVLLDMRYGYNLRPLSMAVAPLTGKLVDGDKLVDLTEDQWRKLFKGALKGAPIMRIGDALFNLNEYLPGLEVEAAKKAFEVESAQKLNSPELSASPTPDSADVNLDSSPDTSTTTPDA